MELSKVKRLSLKLETIEFSQNEVLMEERRLLLFKDFVFFFVGEKIKRVSNPLPNDKIQNGNKETNKFKL